MKLNLLLILALAGLATACGDDDTPDATVTEDMTVGGDMTVGEDMNVPDVVVTPPNCEFPDDQSGSCCYRESNSASLDAPNLRLSGLRVNSPAPLANPVIVNILNDAFDSEEFNWLMQLSGATADGEITIKTGFGEIQADKSFTFANGTAPTAGGDAARWDPVTAMGSIAGETVTLPPLTSVLTVPVLNDAGEPVIELPLQALTVENMVLSEDRSCVGARSGNRWVTAADISTYLTIDGTKEGEINQPPIVSELCLFISNPSMAGPDVSCDSIPQADWETKPDSLCEAGVCTDACDPATTCNAWLLSGSFSGQGVAIN